jgi:hypothetical protein
MRKLLPPALVCALAIGSPPAVAAEGDDCAYELVPIAVEGSVVLAEPVLIGCFATYAEALAAGSGGEIQAEADATPLTVSDAEVATTSSSVLIGTEWDAINYSGPSNSYFAASTCTASTTWQVSYVTDAWNDLFSSGKGFGGCDRNRKFEHSNFGGASLLCTPNCSNYGSLSNKVSSLRWSA